MNIKDRLSYTNRIISLLGKGEAVVLTGHRRAGKSCILECLADKLKGSGNVMCLDMENPDNRDVDTDEKLNIWIKEHSSDNNRNIVLIDEVQEIRDFEKTLRYWVKQSGFDVVVTGSNAKMLSSDVASAFSGRYMQVHVFSLDYGEFLDFNGITSSAEALAMYLKWGGLPFLSNIPADDTRTRNNYLDNIYNTIFVKDIINRIPVRNPVFVDNLARFIAENCGKLFSANSIAKFMKNSTLSVSSNTVDNYTDALCATYLIDRVHRYDIRGKRIFEQQDKFYFEDIGLRNYLCLSKSNIDIEKVLENAVYLRLRKDGFEVFVGQINGKEIDFVALRGDEKVYVQVSLNVSNPDTYEREFGNLRQIRDNYPKYVITMDPMATLVNDNGIKVLLADSFLLHGI